MVANRKNVMIGLSVLTAITLIGQYIMTGSVGLGDGSLPDWFANWEKALWGLRSLVEIGVVVYIGTTRAESKAQERNLWTFKGMMIVLIVLTVGPVWASFQLSKPIALLFGDWFAIGWSFLLAGVSAAMLAGVAYAYQVQPHNSDLIVLEPSEHQSLLDLATGWEQKATDAERNLQRVSDRLTDLEHEHDIVVAGVQGMRLMAEVIHGLKASDVLRFLRDNTEGDLPDTEVLAQFLDVDGKYIKRVLKN